jgi:hypothetical protein
MHAAGLRFGGASGIGHAAKLRLLEWVEESALVAARDANGVKIRDGFGMLDDAVLKLFGEAHYENRIVIFYDVLGWKDRIERGGRNPHLIAQLKLVVSALGFDETGGFGVQESRLTSFSDNVVVSLPFDIETLPRVLEGLAKVQLGMAMWGFFIRGSVTIGEIHHDNRTVFGPALVRAYELESRHADIPRIILDPEVPALKRYSGLIARDDKFDFLDPFTISFVDRIRFDVGPEHAIKFLSEQGAKPLPASEFVNLPPQIQLWLVLHYLAEELRLSPVPKVRAKLEWLYNRIAPRAGIREKPESFHLEKMIFINKRS